MKRFIVFMFAILSIGICNAQFVLSDSDKAPLPKTDLDRYEFYLDKSTKFQTAAIGSAAISVGCFIGYACQKEKFEFKDDSHEKLKMKDTPKALLICGGIAAASAVVCELFAINYKLESGRYLKIHLTGNGANVSLRF